MAKAAAIPAIVAAVQEPPQVTEYEVLKPYPHGSLYIRSFLVQPGTKAKSLVELARRLHNEYPTSHIQFFDDATKYDDLRKSDEYYRGLGPSKHPYPDEWADEHLVGMVHTSYGNWFLSDAAATHISALIDQPPQSQVEKRVATVPNSANGADSSSHKGAGGIVRLRDDSFVGRDEESLDRLVRLSVSKDSEGVAELLLTGRVWVAKSGTKVRVIETGFFTYEIRILSGHLKGRSGFLSAEDVR